MSYLAVLLNDVIGYNANVEKSIIMSLVPNQLSTYKLLEERFVGLIHCRENTMIVGLVKHAESPWRSYVHELTQHFKKISVAKLCLWGYSMDYWYVFMTRTGDEDRVRDILIQRLDSTGNFQSFVPRREIQIKHQGKRKLETQVCFPGYVFIQSFFSPEDFLVFAYKTVIQIKQVYKLLSYSSSILDIALKEDEKDILNKLMDENHCVCESTGYIEGDLIRINDGALIGMESIIKKVNLHNRTATVELAFMGSTRLVVVGLNVIEKV